MKTSIAILGCLVATAAFAGHDPLHPTPAELASGTVHRDFASRASRVFDGFGTPATESTVVKYADLDLSKPAEAATLYTRIQQAARTVCPGYPLRELGRLQIWRNCYSTAVTQAVASVDHPSLTTLYQRASRVPVATARTAAN